MSDQEYYPEQEYLYNGEYVKIHCLVPDEDDLVIVENDHGELIVARFSNMERKEDSYYYQRAEERRKELEAITKKAKDNLDAIADKVVDKALIALSSRMKFNVLFGKGSGNAWVLPVVEELEKMIKEKAKDELEKFEL